MFSEKQLLENRVYQDDATVSPDSYIDIIESVMYCN